MKKFNFIAYIVLLGTLLFQACEPTKDFTDEYNDLSKSQDSANFQNYTKVKLADTVTVTKLADKDYARSSAASIKSNKNFSESYPAKTYLPEVMNKAYIAKTGAQVTIQYNYYDPLTLKDSVAYTLEDAEYPNQTNKYFGSTSEVFTYLFARYPGATRGKVVVLTYKLKAGQVTNSFIYFGKEWMQAIAFTQANYTSMGQSYANFSTVNDARYNIPIFLKNSFLPYAKTGDKILVQYALFTSGKTTQNVLLLNFDGTSWKITDAVVTGSSICAYTGSSWNFIPPLKVILVDEAAARSYTFTDADYTVVGNGQYKNFDRRAGKPEEKDDVFFGKIGTILKLRFADIAAGQVYAVTYKDYNGTATDKTVNVKAIPAE